MFDRREIVVRQERYQNFLLEAEQYRLARQVASGREKRHLFHGRALTWLGRHLIAWGCSLEKRYGASLESPAVAAVNRCR
jgi:hypothetical protein